MDHIFLAKSSSGFVFELLIFRIVLDLVLDGGTISNVLPDMDRCLRRLYFNSEELFSESASIVYDARKVSTLYYYY